MLIMGGKNSVVFVSRLGNLSSAAEASYILPREVNRMAKAKGKGKGKKKK